MPRQSKKRLSTKKSSAQEKHAKFTNPLNVFNQTIRKKKYRKTPFPEPTTTLEKMNCNPVVKHKTLTKDTCYTPHILAKIKTAYNENHPKDKIKATFPEDVLYELRKRMTNCKKEDCWLEQIKDAEMHRQIDDLIFAPDQPKEWKNDPDEWLSNFDIAAVLRQYEKSHLHFKLLGPSSIDYDTIISNDGDHDDHENNGSDPKKCVWEELCRLSLADLIEHKKRKLGIVFNLDKHDEPGSHWVSMFVDFDHALIFYYDSALNEIPSEILRLKEEIIKQGKELASPIYFKFIHNKHMHQQSNTECGMYALFFIITMLTRSVEPIAKKRGSEPTGGEHMQAQTTSRARKGKIGFDFSDQEMSIHDTTDLFLNNTIPDKYVKEYRNIYFNR
jgi:hypothetical protein